MGWRVVESRTAFENSLLLLRDLALNPPNGEPSHCTYVERGPAVMVLPVTHQGEIVMMRQFRFPVDEWCLELPMGTAVETPGKPLHAVVAEELEADIGGSFDALEEVGSFYTSPALSDESCHVFLAVGVSMRLAPPEARDDVRIVRKPVAEVVQLIRCGRLKHGPTALAILLCEPRLLELGFI